MSRRERIQVAEALRITGIATRRTLQAMAARGEIPGAAKPGGKWTFNEAKLRAWVAAKEQEACRKTLDTPIGAGTSITTASALTDRSIEARYIQAKQKLRDAARENSGTR